jgi:hypothetical protein
MSERIALYGARHQCMDITTGNGCPDGIHDDGHWFRLLSYATEQDFWTLWLEKVMILSPGTSFSAEGKHDIDTHAMDRLGL